MLRPPGDAVYLLYNPIDDAVMSPFAESVAWRHPPGNRTAILYANPMHNGVFDRGARFVAIGRSARSAVFEIADAAAAAHFVHRP